VEKAKTAINNSKATVLIVDDYPLFRHGLRALLSEQEDISVVGEAATGAEAEAALGKLRPSVVLLDLDLPDRNGLELLEELKTRHPGVRSIVMAGPDDDFSLAEAIEKGAAGYMLKTAGPPLILAAVRTVNAGGTWLQREVTGKLFQEFTRLAQIRREAPDGVLTDRETEVLTLLAQGLKNGEIAERLYITERTVKVHVSNIFRKLGLTDRVQATRYAIRQRLVTL
jgi:two-component system response regulator DegU